MKITTNTKTFLADTTTPVGLYLNLRDKFYNSFLLESSDYHSNENALSFICLSPLASFKVENNSIIINGLGLDKKTEIEKGDDVTLGLQQFINQFQVTEKSINGIFGYTAYDAIQYFEKLTIIENQEDNAIPILNYSFYKYIIQINHFKNELTIIENLVDNEVSEIDKIEKLVKTTSHPQYHFNLEGKQTSNLTDNDFKEMVIKGKFHCQQGDVFQMVLSRQFSQKYKGDEFNVYRALRSVNPSPYLFYFDFCLYFSINFYFSNCRFIRTLKDDLPCDFY